MVTEPSVGVYWGVYLSRSSGLTPNTWSWLVEQKGMIPRSVLPNSVAPADRDIKGSVSMKNWLDTEWQDPDRIGTVAANPSSMVYCHVVMSASDVSSDPAVTYFYIVIDYDVLFFEPIKQPQS